DRNVTGVQTCALPIFSSSSGPFAAPLAQEGLSGVPQDAGDRSGHLGVQRRIGGEDLLDLRLAEITEILEPQPALLGAVHRVSVRSEERRVGKEWRGWG